MYVINGIDLKPINNNNYLDKYADDSYLIIPSNKEVSIDQELDSISKWAGNNNLTLNKSKSEELIVFSSSKSRLKSQAVTPIPDIKRVDHLKILGVTIGQTLSVSEHVSEIIHLSAQSLYALKVLKTHGLDPASLHHVCQATIVSRLTYASPSWWGFASKEDSLRLQSVLNRAKRWGLCDKALPPIEEICGKLECNLFQKVLSSPAHPLHHLLPPPTTHTHDLRPRAHDRQIPKKGNSCLSKTFLHRMLFKDMY